MRSTLPALALSLFVLAASLPAEAVAPAPSGAAAGGALTSGGRSSRARARAGIDGRLKGRSADTAWSLFSTYEPPSLFERNASVWTGALDFSGVSIWNSANLDNTGGNRGYGTLISRRHVVFANHFFPGPGSTLFFLGRDGVLVTRTLLNTARVGLTDIRIGVLSADVPETVAVYPLLSASYHSPSTDPAGSLIPPVPMLCLNQKRQAVVHDWHEIAGEVTHGVSFDPLRARFSIPLIIGDSGAPMFLVVDRQLVLLACHFSATHGPSLVAHAGAIEAVMKALGGGNGLRRFEWSE